MSVWRHALIALIALALAACNEKEPTYQGWVEANLIFVGPDEAGRIETLAVREGDRGCGRPMPRRVGGRGAGRSRGQFRAGRHRVARVAGAGPQTSRLLRICNEVG